MGGKKEFCTNYKPMRNKLIGSLIGLVEKTSSPHFDSLIKNHTGWSGSRMG